MAPKKATAKAQPGRRTKVASNSKGGAKEPRPKPAAASKQKPKPPSGSSSRASGGLRNVDAPIPPAKRTYDDSHPERPSKRTKTDSKRKSPTIKAVHERQPVINQVPTKVLNILVFGNGDNSELGLGPKQTESSRPRLNPSLDPEDPTKHHITAVACGGMHTIALTVEGRIVTWGVNDEFALGRDTHWNPEIHDVDAVPDHDAELNPLESTPTAIPDAHFPPNTRFCQVAAGDSYSMALTDTGLVYGWGTFRDSEGKSRFGYDTRDGTIIKNQKTPLLIQGLKEITQIVCGANHAMALDSSGQIFAWGSNDQLQFARRLFGRHQDCLRPRLVRVCRGNAKYIAAGEYHCFAVDRVDNVWAWGLNSYGEAGYASTAGKDSAILPWPIKIRDLCGKSVTTISGGAHHSAAVTADGQCLLWGRLDGGQLGIRFSAEQLQDTTLIRYDDRGKPRICLRPAAIPGTFTHVACGTDHTLFISKQGELYATGFGSEGQLGLGSDEDVEVAQLVKGKHLKEKILTWAGAGGQFSVVAGPA
ncbi:hypothetical protein HIM_08300 [Hirsutella minnesotensis 3608]|uniref:RCC1-like domain-containing protein n=1 Tax=Hirsutella minnesotensis 3608 TaxID=1043627 RepID=A0A0F8A3Q9_9HYPO|nr:hypothetical protein HIM_08300 [Hirsutella minnesotensis 3608]